MRLRHALLLAATTGCGAPLPPEPPVAASPIASIESPPPAPPAPPASTPAVASAPPPEPPAASASAPPAPPPQRPGGTLGVLRVSGRLPPDEIKRVVRQSFPRLRRCYEDNLRNSPNLQARVSVRFLIESDGKVRRSEDNGSDIPDRATIDCVVRVFRDFVFPKPEGGQVLVTYPVMFSPGD